MAGAKGSRVWTGGAARLGLRTWPEMQCVRHVEEKMAVPAGTDAISSSTAVCVRPSRATHASRALQTRTRQRPQ